MDRRKLLLGMTTVVAGAVTFGCGGNFAAAPLAPPPDADQTTLTDRYTLWDGRYELDVQLTYQGTTVTQFVLQILKHPYPTTVEGLLLESLVLEASDRQKFQLLLGSQPLFERLLVTPKQLPIRLKGHFWYLVDNAWVPENIASRVVIPSQTVKITLGDNLPATII